MSTAHTPGCDERHGSTARCNNDSVATSRSLRVGVALELAPVWAIGIGLALGCVGRITQSFSVFDRSSGNVALGYIGAYVAFYCGGLGWILVGRDDIGSKVLVSRAVLLVIITFFMLSSIDNGTGLATWAVVTFAIAGVGASRCSAISLWRFGVRVTVVGAQASERRR